jgi:flagellar biosynthesis/type III secretory pathway protein FliH
MTLSDLEKPVPIWAADPLLNAKANSPSYTRKQWDEKSIQNFGPWRMGQKAEPTLNQTTPFVPAIAPPGTADALASLDHSSAEPKPMADIVETVQSQLSETALNALRDEAYQRGLEAGMAQAKEELQEERQHERALFRHLTIELRSLNQDPQRFFEPLKRLSLHVAEQLVRGELQISGHVIDTLIKQCLEQFDHPADKAVVSLNPADLQRLRAMDPSVTQGLELEPDNLLNAGSVRVKVNDTVVQDLIEHRLEPLVRRLLNQPEAWINRSALLNKEKIDVSEVSLPSRDWGRPLPDVQDTEIKPVTPSSTQDEPEVTPEDSLENKHEDKHDGL